MEPFRFKSDLRNHQAIVQPRLYDCLMVTQITLIVNGKRPEDLAEDYPDMYTRFYRGLHALRAAGTGSVIRVDLPRDRSTAKKDR